MVCVNLVCGRIAVIAPVVYCVFVLATFVCFADDLVYLEETERIVAGIAASALSSSMALRLFLQLVRGYYAPRRIRNRVLGVTQLSHSTSLIAATTSWILCFAKVPVVVDPITGCRVHLVRWCEWTVLAFVMTFMTEVTDERGQRRVNGVLSLSLSLHNCVLEIIQEIQTNKQKLCFPRM